MNHEWQDVSLILFKYDSEQNCVDLELGSMYDGSVLADIKIQGIDLLSVELSGKIPLFVAEAYLGDLASENAMKKFSTENSVGVFIYLTGALIDVEILAWSYAVNKRGRS